MDETKKLVQLLYFTHAFHILDFYSVTEKFYQSLGGPGDIYLAIL